MSHKIYKATPITDYVIEVTFFNGEIKQYDTRLLIEDNVNQGTKPKVLLTYASLLIDKSKSTLRIGSDLLIDSEELWSDGISVGQIGIDDSAVNLANSIIDLREAKRMSQRMLAEKSGVYQAEISKIERAEGNPSLSTISRLANGLNKDLSINFTERENKVRSDIPFPTSLSKYLDPNKRQGEFAISDMANLPEGTFAELIDGVIYDNNAPNIKHSRMTTKLSYKFLSYIEERNGDCEVFVPQTGLTFDKDESNFLLPDIMVVCNPDKIKPAYIVGAPDLVVEILSPSTSKRDMSLKQALYCKKGVREYWIIDIDKRKLILYDFENGDVEIHSLDEKVAVKIYDGDLVIDFAEIMKSID